MLYFDYVISQIFWLIVTFSVIFSYIHFRLFPSIRKIFLKRELHLCEMQKKIDEVKEEIDAKSKIMTSKVQKEVSDSRNIVEDVRNQEMKKLEEKKSNLTSKLNKFVSSMKKSSVVSLKDDLNDFSEALSANKNDEDAKKPKNEAFEE